MKVTLVPGHADAWEVAKANHRHSVYAETHTHTHRQIDMHTVMLIAPDTSFYAGQGHETPKLSDRMPQDQTKTHSGICLLLQLSVLFKTGQTLPETHTHTHTPACFVVDTAQG